MEVDLNAARWTCARCETTLTEKRLDAIEANREEIERRFNTLLANGRSAREAAAELAFHQVPGAEQLARVFRPPLGKAVKR